MNKLILVAAFLYAISLLMPNDVLADYLVVGSSAELKSNQEKNISDNRVKVLKAFLESYNSPLSIYSKNFIDSADKYDLDWRLVPAISGVESTFGKHIPANSYNAYGWASGNYIFKSWEESIDIVSQSLRKDYLNRGATSITKIARWYCPPSTSWSWKVQYFMNKLEPLPLDFTLEG
jgi:hypothetical protein